MGNFIAIYLTLLIALIVACWIIWKQGKDYKRLESAFKKRNDEYWDKSHELAGTVNRLERLQTSRDNLKKDYDKAIGKIESLNKVIVKYEKK